MNPQTKNELDSIKHDVERLEDMIDNANSRADFGMIENTIVALSSKVTRLGFYVSNYLKGLSR